MPCSYCEFRCSLETMMGVCSRYKMDASTVVEVEPFHFVEPYFLDAEDMPFFHVEPGRSMIQTGTKGCNAGCDYCINAHLAIEKSNYPLIRYTPQELVRMAEERAATAITFALNEVTMFLPSAIEVAKAAHKAGLLVGCLTNGFQTEEAAIQLATHMDMINVSLKSMSDEFYKQSLRLPSVEPVLRNIEIFHRAAHVEIITPITQDMSIDELHDIMDFIESVDPNIPWHLFRLFKTYQRVDEEGRDFEEIIKFTEFARKRLPFVYFGNFPGSKWVDTLCPECAHRIIQRICMGACGAQYLRDDMTAEDACPQCGFKIPVIRKQ